MRSSRSTWTRLSARVIALSVVAGLLLAMMPLTVHAGRGITFNVWLGDWCVYGRANDKAKVTINWKDSDWVLKARGTVRANHNGYWSFCSDGSERVEKGDSIKARVGSKSRTVKVPTLRLVVDRDTDIAQGRYVSGAKVHLEVCKRHNYYAARCTDVSVTANGGGRFSYDFSPIENLVGRDYVKATVRPGKDKFHRVATVPFIKIIIGKSRFWGYYKPFKRLVVELHRGGSLLDDWSGRADDWDWGYFRGRFADKASDGDTYRVKVGDQVVVPAFGPDADWKVPGVWASVAKKTDVVKGSCTVANGRYEVYARNPSGSRSGYRIGKADSAGKFSMDMTSRHDIRGGDIVFLNCKLWSGDIVARRIVVK